MNFKKEIEQLNKELMDFENHTFAGKQHQKGKLTARERINILFDGDSFVELDPFVESRFDRLGMNKKKCVGDSVITGWGKIDGRIVYVFSQDFSKMGGTLGEMHGEKIIKIIDGARATGSPIIGIIDSGGARIQEGVASLDGYAGIFKAMVRASGIIPQISVVLGPSAGGACYAPGLSDFVFMVEGISQMFITGPEVVKKIIGEETTSEDLGGTTMHRATSGCAHFSFDDENDCFLGVKKLLDFLPQNSAAMKVTPQNFLDALVKKEENLRLLELVPEENEKGYEMRDVITEIFDKNSFFEIHEHFAKNIIVGFARLGDVVVGVVANEPRVMAGVLDINSSDKIARFVRFCDSFNIPLINLVDTPGFLPGVQEEQGGIIRHGAKILYAYAEASVPKISVIIRKAFGGAYIALASRKLGYDAVLSWPSAQIAVMGAEQAAEILYHKEILENVESPIFEKEKIEEMKKYMDPFQAAKLGQIDMIINPKDTRIMLMRYLEPLLTKHKEESVRRHGNIPL